MHRARYRRIIWFFSTIIASLLFWDVFLPRVGFRKWSAHTRPNRMKKSAERFRRLAIAMGGVMIKVGQFLSTRVDILPKEVIAELSGLQDEVPPVPYEAIRVVVEQEFNGRLEEHFYTFDPVPLAAASLGQVHRATLSSKTQPPAGKSSGNGRGLKSPPIDVVVKVQRPNIEYLIRTDLEALQTVCRWLQYYKPIRRRADVLALLDEFSRILYEEIDYLAEGKNAETFAANFTANPNVRVPKVYWTHTTVRVLTLENVLAIKIADYEAITKAGIDRAEVASLLLDTYLKQIFEDGFFHADPHPGNLFVEPSPLPVSPVSIGNLPLHPVNEQDGQPIPKWQITFVDFGMVGHVPSNLRTGLRELIMSVGTRDSPRAVKAYRQMGILLPNADLIRLERAQAHAYERFWGMNMSEITNLNTNDLRDFLSEFRDLVFDMPFQIPQDIIFLVRCVNILSGMCTGLDPQFNVFQHLSPYAKKIINEEARNNRKDWLTEIETLARSWLNAPMKLDVLLAKLERGDITMRDPEVSQQVNRLERAVRMLGSGLIFSALLLGGIQFYLGDQVVGAVALFSGASIILLWIIWKTINSI
jgi:predicted unusual protein kinase regulating ubiquinone biosynthesis (AarF/ABC1/UbiB family)